ncbi:MAG: hypothetical protein ACPG6V_07865 [Flavobacteriales bacterium]
MKYLKSVSNFLFFFGLGIFFFRCSSISTNDEIKISFEKKESKSRLSKGIVHLAKGDLTHSFESGSYGDPGIVELKEIAGKEFVVNQEFFLNQGIGRRVYTVISADNNSFGKQIAKKVIFDYYEEQKEEEGQFVHYILSKEVVPSFGDSITFDIRTYVIRTPETFENKRDTILTFQENEYLKIN